MKDAARGFWQKNARCFYAVVLRLIFNFCCIARAEQT